MRGARVRLEKGLVLELLHLPRTLGIEAYPSYSSTHAHEIDLILVGEDLGEAFEYLEGEMLPEAVLDYRQAPDSAGHLRIVELLAIRRAP